MNRLADDSDARSLGACCSSVATVVCGWVPVTASPRGSTAGAWATDHAPSRSKNLSGSSWYFE